MTMKQVAHESLTGAGTLPVFTAWAPLPDAERFDDWESDPIKDALFAFYVNATLHRVAPWLIDQIRSAGARIVAGPGRFFLLMPDNEAHFVPELSVYMNLLPWTEPGETAH